MDIKRMALLSHPSCDVLFLFLFFLFGFDCRS